MNIVVGVSGGIAAYKVVQLVRLLVSDGHVVDVVPTPDALRFVGAPTWEAISRRPVTTSVHDDVAQVRHVALGQQADLVVVAPATANTIARMAVGIADSLLGTTLLATAAPVIIAPAMHTQMWQHPATQHNVAVLRTRGVRVLGPDDGPLTGGDSGAGRMVSPEAIHAAVLAAAVGARDLDGLRFVVTAGGTREPIDPVRYLGNRSSGRQGVALARAAADRGATVSLIAANVDEAVLAAAGSMGVTTHRVETASELQAVVEREAVIADVVVMAAAVADYRVASVASFKITKEESGGSPTLELTENADILAGLASRRGLGQTLVGFAAEMPREGETLLQRGIRKRRRKGADLLAVNEVGWTTGFERDENAILVVDDRDELIAEVGGNKRAVADGLIDAIIAHRAR